MSRRVVAVVDDMFFAAKIRAVAEATGVEISFVRSKEGLVEKAREAQLVLVDLHNQKLDPMDLATALKSNQELRQIKILGFFSHVHVDLQRSALAAGYDQVLPRSVFTRDLSRILAAD